MQIFQGPQNRMAPLAASVVTIGNFDGVHLGHQQLIETVAREARFFQVPSVVYTFHPHPIRVLKPELPPRRIFDLQDQQQELEKRGIEFILIQNFNLEFAKRTPSDFLENEIFKNLNPKTLVVGHDFSFGQDRAGNLPFLEQFCAARGVRLIIIPPFQLNGAVVSSTRIRECLMQGNLKEARLLLGREYYLRGLVEKGFQRGRTIGVPTANLHPDVEFVPRLGVYVTEAKVQGQWLASVTNIGVNPTFHANDKIPRIKIETHIFDFAGDIYDQEIEVGLKLFLRDEAKFSGIEELKNQIQLDIQEARGWHCANKNS